MDLKISRNAAPVQAGMKNYDLCVAWTDTDDAGFVELLDSVCRERGMSLLQITPTNCERTCEDLTASRLAFRAFYDRATDEDRQFLPVVEWARAHAAYRINPYELARRTWDKAAMHTAVSEAVPTPYTLFIPPYHESQDLPELDLSRLGPSFTIKPAHGPGGGTGVVVVATSTDQIVEARQELPDDMYMVQTRVVPARIDGRAAWFRIIYAAGHVYPFWWDFDTHGYQPVTVAEEVYYGLAPLRSFTEELAHICQLNLFSTEIAIDADGRFVVVDYVNDPIDLRLSSKEPDGVPDQVLGFIAEDLAKLVQSQLA